MFHVPSEQQQIVETPPTRAVALHLGVRPHGRISWMTPPPPLAFQLKSPSESCFVAVVVSLTSCDFFSPLFSEFILITVSSLLLPPLVRSVVDGRSHGVEDTACSPSSFDQTGQRDEDLHAFLPWSCFFLKTVSRWLFVWFLFMSKFRGIRCDLSNQTIWGNNVVDTPNILRVSFTLYSEIWLDEYTHF